MGYWTELNCISNGHTEASGKKTPPGSTPTSIVINFLKYETKENILAKAWKKKMQAGRREIFLDHDYPTEVIKMHKSYSEIKNFLKEKNIRFQAPLSRIRIHWSDGPKIYNNAEDAAQDMRRRQLEIQERHGSRPSLEERIPRAAPWQCIGEKQGTNGGTTASEELSQEAGMKQR